MIADRILQAILACEPVEVSDIKLALTQLHSQGPEQSTAYFDWLTQVAHAAGTAVDAHNKFPSDSDSDDPQVDAGLSYDAFCNSMETLECLIKTPETTPK